VFDHKEPVSEDRLVVFVPVGLRYRNVSRLCGFHRSELRLYVVPFESAVFGRLLVALGADDEAFLVSVPRRRKRDGVARPSFGVFDDVGDLDLFGVSVVEASREVRR